MDAAPLYTIGYGQRSAGEFIALLRRQQIRYLLDVRSQPYSRFNPAFSRGALERALADAGIRYVFMGDTLGGRPADGDCYTDGKVDYAKLGTKAFYQRGIARLLDAWRQGMPVALMCSEAKPQECHRAKLIGETLRGHGVAVEHIDEHGALVSHGAVLGRLAPIQQDLFGEAPRARTSRKVYRAPDAPP